ncbi:hypothetical protein GALL_515130 [mine drainage metagenome]|uniref:Uncharacterized protein n=1 Tax=mine drainage metagenome TaxID=410659 RepID=A0A1J5PNR4_9ZZZZ
MKIMGGETGAGDDVKLIPRHPRHGQIAFNAALFVQHLRIGQRTDRTIDIARRNMVQRGNRPRPFQGKLGKRGLVDKHRRRAAGQMLASDRVEPAGLAVAVKIDRLFPGLQVGKPVGSLPPELLAKAGALPAQMRIQRRAARGAARVMFL